VFPTSPFSNHLYFLLLPSLFAVLSITILRAPPLPSHLPDFS
jgi:hypothetical protein